MVSMKSLRQSIRQAEADGEPVQVDRFPGKRSKVGFLPSDEQFQSYRERSNDKINRIIRSMENPEMVRLAVDFEDVGMDRLCSPNPQGYDYVVKRLKDPVTPNREKSELRKVQDVYRLLIEYEDLLSAMERYDLPKVNRIINGGRAVRS